MDVEADERPVDLGKYEVELERMPRIAVATFSQSLPVATTSTGSASPEAHQNGCVDGTNTFKPHTILVGPR